MAATIPTNSISFSPQMDEKTLDLIVQKVLIAQEAKKQHEDKQTELTDTLSLITTNQESADHNLHIVKDKINAVKDEIDTMGDKVEDMHDQMKNMQIEMEHAYNNLRCKTIAPIILGGVILYLMVIIGLLGFTGYVSMSHQIDEHVQMLDGRLNATLVQLGAAINTTSLQLYMALSTDKYKSSIRLEEQIHKLQHNMYIDMRDIALVTIIIHAALICLVIKTVLPGFVRKLDTLDKFDQLNQLLVSVHALHTKVETLLQPSTASSVPTPTTEAPPSVVITTPPSTVTTAPTSSVSASQSTTTDTPITPKPSFGKFTGFGFSAPPSQSTSTPSQINK
jgi:hypothetical protein